MAFCWAEVRFHVKYFLITDMEKAEEESRSALREVTSKAAVKRKEFQDKQREGQQDTKKIFEDLNMAGNVSRGTFSAFEVGSLADNNINQKQLSELIAIRIAMETVADEATEGQAVVGA